MKRIVVLNPKGGSGKTTLAINLASYYASRQQKPVLMDFDPQGSSVRWAKKRQAAQPPIHVIAAYENDARTTRAFQLRIPRYATHVIVDTPAALDSPKLPRDHARCAQDHRARAAVGHRYSCLLPHHPRPPAGGEDSSRG